MVLGTRFVLAFQAIRFWGLKSEKVYRFSGWRDEGVFKKVPFGVYLQNMAPGARNKSHKSQWNFPCSTMVFSEWRPNGKVKTQHAMN